MRTERQKGEAETGKERERPWQIGSPEKRVGARQGRERGEAEMGVGGTAGRREGWAEPTAFPYDPVGAPRPRAPLSPLRPGGGTPALVLHSLPSDPVGAPRPQAPLSPDQATAPVEGAPEDRAVTPALGRAGRPKGTITPLV